MNWRLVEDFTTWKLNAAVIAVCLFVAGLGWWAASLTGG